jgi:phage gp36-like protein
MAYATQADIEARYPGELAQAGPRDADNVLDAAAIALALELASATVDRYLRAIGWPVPVTATPVPDWLAQLTVDLGLYLATPTVLASQADFADRRDRYRDALAQLEAIARGDIRPPWPGAEAGVNGGLTPVYGAGNARVFGRGTL